MKRQQQQQQQQQARQQQGRSGSGSSSGSGQRHRSNSHSRRRCLGLKVRCDVQPSPLFGGSYCILVFIAASSATACNDRNRVGECAVSVIKMLVCIAAACRWLSVLLHGCMACAAAAVVPLQNMTVVAMQAELLPTHGVAATACLKSFVRCTVGNLAKRALMVTTRAEHVFCVATQRLLGGICSAFPRSDCYMQKWLAHGYTPNTCLWMLWHVTRSHWWKLQCWVYWCTIGL
jgi:hypothetical protein